MYEEKLNEVICETAEQMFFQEFENSSESSELPDGVFWAAIDVTSPRSFEIIIAAAETEVRDAIALLFGDDGEKNDVRAADVVAELANTIAGSLARHLSDDQALQLSPPTKGRGAAPVRPLYEAFSSDDMTLFIAVSAPGSIR